MSLGLSLSASDHKVDWASEHIAMLERELPLAIAEHGAYTFRFSQVDPDTGWCEIFASSPLSANPRFRLIAGDAIHNLRSALNYVITALVDASDGAILRIGHQFPIFRDRTHFGRSCGMLDTPAGPLAGIRHGLGLIEQLQPYHRDPDPRLDPLWHIHRLDNADKHRELTAFLPMPLERLNIHFRGGLVESHSAQNITAWTTDEEFVVHRMRFDPPVATDFHIETPIQVILLFTTPAFGQEPMHMVPVGALREICDHVRMIVDLFKTI